MMRQRKRRKKPGNVANQPMRAMPESVLRLAREIDERRPGWISRVSQMVDEVVGEKGRAPREGGAEKEIHGRSSGHAPQRGGTRT